MVFKRFSRIEINVTRSDRGFLARPSDSNRYFVLCRISPSSNVIFTRRSVISPFRVPISDCGSFVSYRIVLFNRLNVWNSIFSTSVEWNINKYTIKINVEARDRNKLLLTLSQSYSTLSKLYQKLHSKLCKKRFTYYHSRPGRPKQWENFNWQQYHI